MVDDFVCIIIVDNLFRIRELVVRCFVKQVHLDYLEAGANIIITASYQVPLFFQLKHFIYFMSMRHFCGS